MIEYGENLTSICLDGKWGSGKSTIANILMNSLQRKKKNKILIQFPKFLLAVADLDTLKNQFFNLCYQIKVDSEK